MYLYKEICPIFTLDYQSLCKDKRLYKNILGITQTEYEQLIPKFTKSLGQIRVNRYLDNSKRKRCKGLKHSKQMRHIKLHRKKPKQELTEEEKRNNKTLSSLRVQVEHVICHLNYFKIFSNKLRYRKRKYDDQTANIVLGIYNLKFS